MTRRGQVNLVLLVLIIAAAGFLGYRRFRKHETVMSVSATDCKGVVEVEHTVFEDDLPVDGGRTNLGDKNPAATVSWTSPTLRHRAGAMYTVLARGDCKTMSCQIKIDGQLVGQGGVQDKQQVTCTAMLGN